MQRRTWLSGGLVSGLAAGLTQQFAAQQFALQPAAAQAPAGAMPAPKRAAITSSVMLWTLPGTLPQKLEIAAKAGLQSVELVAEHTTMDAQGLKDFGRLCRSFKLGVDALSATPTWKRMKLNMVDPAARPALLAEVEKNLAVAQRLEIPMALLMSGDALPGRPFEAQFSSMVEGAKRCGDLAAKYGVTLIVEPLNTKVNHAGYFLSNCVDGLRLIKEADHESVRLLFDLYHEQVERGDVTRTAKEALPYVKVFHIAGNPGRNEPSIGEMNYAHLYREISRAGFTGYLTMEYLPTKEPVASLTQAVNEMRAAL